tara:strand:- start:1517 stop:2122 length:606 start_codon:yes stop_codon:yes gene_type:complete
MKHKKIDNFVIEEMLSREFDQLKKSLKNAKHPYHSFCFSTINLESPSVRTVILRNFRDRFLFFNSDIRSSKVQDIYNNSKVSALFYDKNRRIQLRIIGKANIDYKNDASKKVWENVDLQSRKCYMGPFTPGEEMKNWVPNLPLNYIEMDPSRQDSESGYENFCSISIQIDSIEILELHYDGHVRFMVEYEKNKKSKYFLAT